MKYKIGDKVILKKELEEQVVELQKSNNVMKGLLIVLIVVMLVSTCFGIGFIVDEKLAENKDENKTEDKEEVTDTENKEEEKEEDKVVLPSDSELIERSKVLKNNFNLLMSGNFEVEEKETKFSELTTAVYKIKRPNELVKIVDDTFVDHNTAWKFVPYYEKNNVYYSPNGSGGFAGAGHFIFEYKVIDKTETTAVVEIDYIECYDEEIRDTIASCTNNPWNKVFEMKFNLKNKNDKWLIESMESDIGFSIIK